MLRQPLSLEFLQLGNPQGNGLPIGQRAQLTIIPLARVLPEHTVTTGVPDTISTNQTYDFNISQSYLTGGTATLSYNSTNTFTFNTDAVTFGGNPISFSNMAHVSIVPRGDNLEVNSGTLTLLAQTAGAGILVRQFGNVTIQSGASQPSCSRTRYMIVF